MKHPHLALVTFALLAGCVQPQAPSAPPAPPPKTAPLPAPPPRPAPAPLQNWLDMPLATGDWVYRQDARGSIALFGAPGADADFIIRCDRGLRKIFISRAGNAPSNSMMQVQTSAGTGGWPVQAAGATPAYMAADVPPYDETLDKIIYSRGRFAATTPGLAPIAIPVWAEFARVVEDCRG